MMFMYNTELNFGGIDLTENGLTESEKMEYVLNVLYDFNFIEEWDIGVILDIADLGIDFTKNELLNLYDVLSKIRNFDGLNENHMENILNNSNFIGSDLEINIEAVRNGTITFYEDRENFLNEFLEMTINFSSIEPLDDLRNFINEEIKDLMFDEYVKNLSYDSIEVIETDSQIIVIYPY